MGLEPRFVLLMASYPPSFGLFCFFIKMLKLLTICFSVSFPLPNMFFHLT